jgi:hypothetical protein
MATKKQTNAKQTAVVVTLAMIVAATLADSFLYTNAATHGPMVEAGTVEVNPSMTNPENAAEFATRATPKGIESMNAPTAAPAAKSAFKLDDAVALPTIKRGGRQGNIYPFDEMAVGQSFFVAADSDKPDPAKSLASTVSSATARYMVETGDAETVEVKTYQTGEDGKRVKVDGKFVVVSVANETRPKMAETRKFVVRSVVENSIKGARVWRTA